MFPTTRHLRCWNHKRLNILDKLPRRLHKEAGAALSALYTSPTRAECTRLRDAYSTQLRVQGQAQAAECLCPDPLRLVQVVCGPIWP